LSFIKRREIHEAILSGGNVHVIVSMQQAVKDKQADVFEPINRGVIKWEQLIEIGAFLVGDSENRTRLDQITFYKNNAGQGVADVAWGRRYWRISSLRKVD
jgi:ornithine cyclodeaminase/alanine dehydrogenase-like protein (mu-crystallin family)